MTKNPITTSPRVSVASSAHTMVWEGIELLPVVDNHRKLVGVLSRNDVLKALQFTAKQPQMSETFPNLIMSQRFLRHVLSDYIIVKDFANIYRF